MQDLEQDVAGFHAAPKRYQTDSGRETIGLIRDSMSDQEFGLFCRAQALKYHSRLGKKDEHDAEKMRCHPGGRFGNGEVTRRHVRDRRRLDDQCEDETRRRGRLLIARAEGEPEHYR